MNELPAVSELPQAGWIKRRDKEIDSIRAWMNNQLHKAILKALDKAKEGTYNFRVNVEPPKGFPYDTLSECNEVIAKINKQLSSKGYTAKPNMDCSGNHKVRNNVLVEWKTPSKPRSSF